MEDRPTAIIAINDFAASGALRSIREHHLKVPDDISVISFDNTYITELMVPKLTSVDYNYDDYGEKLIQTAIAVAKGEIVDDVQMVIPSLVIRESTGSRK
jgi:LacI family transcriptional regulator